MSNPTVIERTLLDSLESEMPEWKVPLADIRRHDAPIETVIVRADSRFGAYAAALVGRPIHIVAADHPWRLDS